MARISYCFLFISLLINGALFSQNYTYNELFVSSIDSLINKELTFQKNNKDIETLVFLKDSMINYYYDDVIEDCENQPTRSYYTYNNNGNIILLESENTPEPGCDQYKRKDIITYNGNNVTSRTVQYYDFALNEWVNNSRRTYQFDSNGNEIEDLWEKWDTDNSAWYNYLKFEQIFNGNLLIEEKRYQWELGINSWFWNLGKLYTFDGNNNLLEYTYKLWDYSLNEWETLRKKTYEYDSNNNVIEYINYIKYTNQEVYEWDVIDQFNYSYDSNNFLIEEFSNKDWENTVGDWLTKKHFIYTNNSNGLPTETVMYLWNENTSEWENDTYFLTTYNSNKDILENIKKTWQNNSWKNFRKETNQYNTVFNWTEKLTQNWDSNTWENFKRLTASYNNYDNIVNFKYQYWGSSGWYSDLEDDYVYDEYQNLIHYTSSYVFDYTSVYYYYSEYDIELDTYDNALFDEVSIIPNPSNNFINIIGLKQNAEVKIYDINGKLIISTLISENNQIDISEINSGLYLVKINNNNLTITKKLLKN